TTRNIRRTSPRSRRWSSKRTPRAICSIAAPCLIRTFTTNDAVFFRLPPPLAGEGRGGGALRKQTIIVCGHARPSARLAHPTETFDARHLYKYARRRSHGDRRRQQHLGNESQQFGHPNP